jgi:hypothetical protein
MINEKGKDLKTVKEKVPIIYDFWVKTNFIAGK